MSLKFPQGNGRGFPENIPTDPADVDVRFPYDCVSNRVDNIGLYLLLAGDAAQLTVRHLVNPIHI